MGVVGLERKTAPERFLELGFVIMLTVDSGTALSILADLAIEETVDLQVASLFTGVHPEHGYCRLKVNVVGPSQLYTRESVELNQELESVLARYRTA